MSTAVVGQPFTVVYTPTVNGQPTDLVSAGGTVDTLTVYDTNNTTVLVTAGPATHIGTAQYQFNVPAINKAGTFAVSVAFTPFTGSTQVIDSNESITVYAFAGSLTPPYTAQNGAWNYSGDPSASDKDAVRFLLGDTDPSDPLLTDGSITFLLAQWVDVYSAAAAGAEQIAGQFARETSYSGDGVMVDFDTLQQKYMTLAGQLRKMGKRFGRAAVPYVGGMLRSENEAARADNNTELTLFAVGMHDDFREGASGNTDNRELLSDQRYGGAS